MTITKDDLVYACSNEVQAICASAGALRLGNLVPHMAEELVAQVRKLEARVGERESRVRDLEWDREQMKARVAERLKQRPLVGICVLVVKSGKILLGKRKGSHGAGEYAAPGGHLEHLESFDACASREVLEETGLVIGPPRLLRVENVTAYAPKHYVDLAFVAEWISGEPAVLEPDKVERWGWYALDDLPTPLFAMLPSAIAAWQVDP